MTPMTGGHVSDEELRALVDSIYASVLAAANEILYNCKTFPMTVLQLKDPSYSEIAVQLRKLCGFMELMIIDGHTEYTVSKAKDYTDFAHDVAKAIEIGDEAKLNELIEILDRRPFT